MLGFYNYTVILTYIGMLSSFYGIVNILENNTFTAVICLMVSGLCDMFDGKIASTMKRTRSEKDFGIQIDSLSDLICFGVFPGILCYSLNSTVFVMIISGLYVLAALIRLAYFNVDEANRQTTTDEVREIYFGLPVTTSALIIPFVFSLNHLIPFNIETVLPVVLLIMSVLFLTPFQSKKPKTAGKIIVMIIGIIILSVLVMKGIQ